MFVCENVQKSAGFFFPLEKKNVGIKLVTRDKEKVGVLLQVCFIFFCSVMSIVAALRGTKIWLGSSKLSHGQGEKVK